MVSDPKEDNTMQLAEFTTTLKVVNGVGYLKAILNLVLTPHLMNFILSHIKESPHSNFVKRFLEAGYVDNNVFHKSKEGTPQCGLLSRAT